jgi:hypothetical protein
MKLSKQGRLIETCSQKEAQTATRNFLMLMMIPSSSKAPRVLLIDKTSSLHKKTQSDQKPKAQSPKPVQTDRQQKELLQQPPNKSEFQTLYKTLTNSSTQPKKTILMQAAHNSELKQKHTPPKISQQNFAAKFILEINSNTTTTTTTTTMSAFKLFSLRNKTKHGENVSFMHPMRKKPQHANH